MTGSYKTIDVLVEEKSYKPRDGCLNQSSNLSFFKTKPKKIKFK